MCSLNNIYLSMYAYLNVNVNLNVNMLVCMLVCCVCVSDLVQRNFTSGAAMMGSNQSYKAHHFAEVVFHHAQHIVEIIINHNSY